MSKLQQLDALGYTSGAGRHVCELACEGKSTLIMR